MILPFYIQFPAVGRMIFTKFPLYKVFCTVFFFGRKNQCLTNTCAKPAPTHTHTHTHLHGSISSALQHYAFPNRGTRSFFFFSVIQKHETSTPSNTHTHAQTAAASFSCQSACQRACQSNDDQEGECVPRWLQIAVCSLRLRTMMGCCFPIQS